MIELREFQVKAIDDLNTSWSAGKRRLLLQAATGSGKTVMSAHIIQQLAAEGKFIVFLAHRRELVQQCTKKLEAFGVPSGQIMAGELYDQSHKVQVASIQTIHSWLVRRRSIAQHPADLIVIDEAHHLSGSSTWRDIMALYPNAMVLGMTATPINRRGKGLGHMFDEMIRCPNVKQLTDAGYLVPAKYRVPSLVDLQGIKVTAGDYNEKALEQAMNKPKLIGDIVENWARFASDRQTLCFASGVRHSINIRDQFIALGIKAAHVDGKTKTDVRDEIVRQFNAGEIQVLTNCGVFTEGTDLPTANCIVAARPTRSLLLYIQMMGRGLRSSPGKTECLILDHAGLVFEFGTIDQDWPWQLDYGDSTVRQDYKKANGVLRDIVCLKCKTVYHKRVDCPECGWRPTVQGKVVETWPAYLEAREEMENPKPNEQEWYLMMRGFCQRYNKNEGAAFYWFQQKFGHKPPWPWRDLQPIEPSLEVRSYCRSCLIRYSKSRHNPNNQN